MSDELPEGWARVQLPDAFMLNPPKPAADEVPGNTSVSFVPMGAVDSEIGAVTTAEERTFADVRKGYTSFRDGDVIMAKITPCFENGKIAVARDLLSGLGFGSTEFHVFRSRGAVESRYLFHFLRQQKFRDDAAEFMTGTAGQARVPIDYMKGVELPVPPLAEQRRIVAKVEELLTEVNRAKVRLIKVQTILKRFRQSVLAAACSGELTREWRSKTSPAEVEWASSTVEQVCTKIVDCPHSTPKWADAGEICLRTTNFFATGLDLREVRRVSRDTFTQRTSRLTPEPGDIVYSREGGILGIACEIPVGLKACLGQRMMLMRADPRRIRPGFLCLVLNSPSTLATVKELTGGTAAPHLNVGDIKKFAVPLPDIDEQDAVLAKVNAMLKLIDLIGARTARASSQTEKLPQAILSKAFSGELVPTEAEVARLEGRDYEPASALIQGLRDTAPASTTKAGARATRRQRAAVV